MDYSALGPAALDPNSIPLGGSAAAAAGLDANSVPLVQPAGEQGAAEQPAAAAEPAPDVEWWDRVLLVHGSYEQDVSVEEVALKDNKVGRIACCRPAGVCLAAANACLAVAAPPSQGPPAPTPPAGDPSWWSSQSP